MKTFHEVSKLNGILNPIVTEYISLWL